MSSRLLASRSTGGIAWRGAGSPIPSSVRGESSIAASDLSSNTGREAEVTEGPAAGLGNGIVQEGGRRKADAFPLTPTIAGRADMSALRVNTGAPGITVSDWSLQSCDDADDGAVSENKQIEKPVP